MGEDWWKIVIPVIGILSPILSAGVVQLISNRLAEKLASKLELETLRGEFNGLGGRVEDLKEKNTKQGSSCESLDSRTTLLEYRMTDAEGDNVSNASGLRELKQIVRENHKELSEKHNKIDRRVYGIEIKNGIANQDREET